MRVTTKGQVTIPQHIREKLGITPTMEVDFVEEKERVYIVKKTVSPQKSRRFRKLRGVATIRMTTEDIMALT
ncbi:MAG: AbrB/MazE/SpoVT family DNA-binding domain-containing protein, partial [Deltaproteobacteria bacterium]|nr:AbrB/MazE/SpoVT family DNA-binding domain-containing protein [Deltaproteobacteria bacterium]